MKTIVLSLAIFICALYTCFASGGNQSLEKSVEDAKLIFKAKVTEVKQGSDKWGHLHIKVEEIEDLKGALEGKSLLLNFQAHVYESEANDKKHGKIKKWYMVPQSGKELEMKKGEIWLFFSYFEPEHKDGYIHVFRGEPIDQEKRTRDLLKTKSRE